MPNVSSWILKNFIKPRMEKMDCPGFVMTKVGSNLQLREVFLPESLVIDIEDEVCEEYGEKSEEALYSAGKNFGWRYAKISNFPQASNSSNRKVKSFTKMFIRYIESVYATHIDYTLDLKEEKFEVEMEGYVVCRENGKGYLLGLGAITGVVAYIFDNKDIEGAKLSCQGRGDEKCNIVCAKTSELSENSFEADIDYDVGLSKNYSDFNKIREAKHSENSMNDLVKKGFFEYDGEIPKYDGQRFLIVETSLLYLLDQELEGFENSQEILFEAAFEAGEKIGEGEKMSFVSDYFPALGWGDVNPVKGGKKIHIRSYPWTKFAEDNEFPIFRGLISGVISGIKDEEIKFEGLKTNISGKSFNLILDS